MRLATVAFEQSSSAAVLFDDDTYGLVRTLAGRNDNGDVMSLIASPLRPDEVSALSRIPLAGVQFLPPVTPRKNVLCVGKNYVAHAIEGARAEGLAKAEIPTTPIWFTKAPTALVGHQGSIIAPAGFENCLDYEGELAVIVGRSARNLTRENALNAVFGYTVFNDVTARDIQEERKQWFKGKSSDTFGPIGPWVVTSDELTDPQSLQITTMINGEIRQDDNTRNMIFSVRDLLVDISQGITLQPGDVIATGTPEGVAWGMTEPKYLKPGDRVSVQIEQIGRFENTVGM